jgi:hypothetical protein
MDLISFLNDLVFYANKIDTGRKGLSTKGKEIEGRINYEQGISGTFAAFQGAQTTDPQTIILTELAFLQQELQFCNESDADAISSLSQAIQSFEDALLSLEAVENPSIYIGAEKTYPHNQKYRIQGLPKDAFHLACIAHRTRLRNVLRAPGINMTEKAVITQRASNMSTAQGSYILKQKLALGV